jgi:hypothetical protein
MTLVGSLVPRERLPNWKLAAPVMGEDGVRADTLVILVASVGARWRSYKQRRWLGVESC